MGNQPSSSFNERSSFNEGLSFNGGSFDVGRHTRNNRSSFNEGLSFNGGSFDASRPRNNLSLDPYLAVNEGIYNSSLSKLNLTNKHSESSAKPTVPFHGLDSVKSFVFDRSQSGNDSLTHPVGSREHMEKVLNDYKFPTLKNIVANSETNVGIPLVSSAQFPNISNQLPFNPSINLNNQVMQSKDRNKEASEGHFDSNRLPNNFYAQTTSQGNPSRNIETITVQRELSTENVILGKMKFGGSEVNTLEPSYKNGEKANSAILPGSYRTTVSTYINSQGKENKCLRLENKNGRSGILVHIGNGKDDTTGCLLVGEIRDTESEKLSLSRKAFDTLYNWSEQQTKEGKELEIVVSDHE